MTRNVSDSIVERLAQWGVERVYGYPGDGINGFFGALNRASDTIEFILHRHEEEAAFAASAHAKFGGGLGVCVATSGPGAVHLLNGLYDARLDHQPVLAIVGQQARTALGSSYQQEIDLVSLYKDVASSYVQMVTVPEQTPEVIDRAIRIALSERTVTCVILPNDVQELEAVDIPDLPRSHGVVASSAGTSLGVPVPSESDIERAADVLNEGEEVAILVGQGARNAVDQVQEVAELLGAGVAKALLGKDVLSDELPYVTGAIGLLGTKPSWDLMMGCDTLLMVGTSFPYAEFLPEPGSARGVEIDIDAKFIGMRYPNEVNLVGDAAATLDALIPKLQRKEDRSWRNQIESGISEWWDVVEARAMVDVDPVNPQRVFWELSPLLPDDAILIADSGSSANWFARDLKIRQGMRASLSGNLATMGCGVPYAIGAKFTNPDRPVVAMVGDGAMQMIGNASLVSIAQHWKKWTDPRLIVLVLHNNDLNQVTWEMRAMSGDPKFEASQHIIDFPYAAYADMIGLAGIRIETADQIVPAWTRALSADRPVVVEAMTSPDVPPVPPHVKWDQMQNMMKAIIKRDPDARDVVVTGMQSELARWKETLRELVPGRS